MGEKIMTATFIRLLGSYKPQESDIQNACFSSARPGVSDVRAAWNNLPKMLLNQQLHPHDRNVVKAALEGKPEGVTLSVLAR
jgi:hypothetical protein